MIDVSNPGSPSFAGCYSADGYTHDVECVVYQGSHAAYRGREICFAYNENSLTILDVDSKSNPVMLSRSTYSGSQYTHQVRGFVKLEKIKIRAKLVSGWVSQAPTRVLNFPPQKKNPSWGLTHPTASEFFSDFLIVFNFRKPLSES